MNTATQKNKNLFKVLSALFFWGITATSSWATHLIGANLKYEWVGGNMYKVIYTVYRDCSGIEVGTTDATLTIRMDSCGTQVLNQAMNYQGIVTGNPYCSSVGSPCTATGRVNSQAYQFSLNVNFNTLPTNIGSVPIPRRYNKWFLSVTINARPSVRNLNGAGNLFSSAMLNNMEYNDPLLGLQPIRNSSSVDLNNELGFRFSCLNQETTVSLASFDPDGDSLVYELLSPKEDCDANSTFNTLDVPVTINGTTYYALPFTSEAPLPSFRVTSTPLGVLAKPYCFLDKMSGIIRFTPMVYTPNSQPTMGRNKYVLSYIVKEYRRLEGRPQLIGFIQRDLIVMVEDCGTNTYPAAPTTSLPTGSNAQITTDSVITLRVPTCNYSVINLNFNSSTSDVLRIVLQNSNGSLPTGTGGSVLQTIVTGDSTTNLSLKLILQPDISLAGKTFNLIAKVQKNTCPLKIVNSYAIRIIVENNNYAKISTPIGNPFGVVCDGLPLTLGAIPNRPDSTADAPASYRYYWDLLPGLNQAEANNQFVTVRPLVNTRYRVRIFNEAINNCVDTASILVRVKPLPSNQRNLGVNGARAVAQGPNLIYRWYNMSGSLVGTADSFTSHSPGQYYLEVTDTSFGYNCTVRSASFMLLSSGKFLESPLKLYPNPASGTVKMEGLPKETPLHFVNSVGQRFELNAQTDGLINVNTLKPGLYIVEAVYQGHIYRQQLVVE